MNNQRYITSNAMLAAFLGKLDAVQNRLEHTIRNLDNVVEPCGA